MNERRYNAGVERLRRPDRVERLQVSHVAALTLDGIPVSSVLDVGTGSGLFAEAFAARGLSVKGIDPNPEMISAAQNYVPTGEFKEGTVEHIPYPDKSFDVVFLGNVLHESDNLHAALNECMRCAIHRVAILEWPYVEEEIGPPLAHRLRDEEIHEMAETVGLILLQTHQMNHMVLYLFQPK